MTEHTESTAATDARLDRRRFLAKATVVGGTVWAVPMLVSSGPAGAAALQSPPPTTTTLPPTTTTTTQPNVTTTTTGDENPNNAEKPPTGTGLQPSGTDTLAPTGFLAQTGENLDQLTRVGLGLAAGGAAFKVWSARAAAAAAADGVPPVDPSAS